MMTTLEDASIESAAPLVGLYPETRFILQSPVANTPQSEEGGPRDQVDKTLDTRSDGNDADPGEVARPDAMESADAFDPRMTFTSLPPEVMLSIFESAGISYGPVIESVCHRWHAIWANRHHFDDADPLIEWALQGHGRLLDWALGLGWIRNGATVVAAAARGGHTSLVRWCAMNKLSVDIRTYEALARGGHQETVVWLGERGHNWYNYDDYPICTAAAEGGHLGVLRWMHASGRLCAKQNVCCLAAAHRHRPILEWMLALQHADPLHETVWDRETCALAAETGDLGLLQWLRANGCPWDSDTIYRAARQGYADVVKWARARGHLWNERACVEAARHGRLGTLRWLRHQGCPWGATVCKEAASKGHLRAVKWAIDNGCRWNLPEPLKAYRKKGYIESVPEIEGWVLVRTDPGAQQQE
jgi:hypothetical protein